MSAATDIYAFETLFPDALKTVLTAAEIKAFTLSDTVNFQKDRPRVEIVFHPGAGREQFIQVNGDPRETSWAGEFELLLVTEAEVNTHLAYLTQIRSTLHGVFGQINDYVLTRHIIQPFIRDGGTVSQWTPQDGCFISRLTVGVDYSVQADAWAALAT
jgi:hypothetical protein